ncbi:MAG: hypothetical protein ACOYXT_29265 [Bacteroidota bacterium]
MNTGKNLLTAAAMLSFAVALLHLIVILWGADGYRYFGAGEEMASMDESGSFIPDLLTLFITLVFALFGLYALSGAHRMKRLPGIKGVLIFISAIYTLRGLGALADIVMIVNMPQYPVRMLYFSLVSLITGLCYLLGTIKNWRSLAPVS